MWAECVFADSVADVAVLGEPDGQALYEQAGAFEKLTDDVPALRITAEAEDGPAWLLALDGGWFRCAARHFGGPLWIFDAAEPIIGGMSGSPILADDGTAIGVVCISRETDDGPSTDGGPNANLTNCLPGWLLRELARDDGLEIPADV